MNYQMLFGKFVPDSFREDLNFPRGGGVGEGTMPPDPSSRHARLHVCECAFACYYHPGTVLFPHPPQLKILYETVYG